MKRIMYIFMIFVTTTLTVAEAREMITVATEEWPPFNFTTENGEVGGIATSGGRGRWAGRPDMLLL